MYSRNLSILYHTIVNIIQFTSYLAIHKQRLLNILCSYMCFGCRRPNTNNPTAADTLNTTTTAFHKNHDCNIGLSALDLN